MSPLPPPCKPEILSSRDIEVDLRFETWRERAHQWVEMLPPPPDTVLDAELSLLRSDNGMLCAMRSSAYEMRTASNRLAHAPDMMILSLIQAGEVVREAAPGERRRIGPGSLGLYDPWQMGDFKWRAGSREVYLALPREEVATAFGRDPGHLLIALEHCPLAPSLISQFNHMALLMRQPNGIDGNEYALLLENTRALALLLLRNLGRQEMNRDIFDQEQTLNAGRRTAALRFMEQHAHRHDLDVTSIARGADCSRTRLYAAFGAHNETVMGVLREIRLQRAKGLIEQSPRLHVGSLAWRCGFSDQSGFSKLFRARFGMAPSEWHQRAWAPPPGR